MHIMFTHLPLIKQRLYNLVDSKTSTFTEDTALHGLAFSVASTEYTDGIDDFMGDELDAETDAEKFKVKQEYDDPDGHGGQEGGFVSGWNEDEGVKLELGEIPCEKKKKKRLNPLKQRVSLKEKKTGMGHVNPTICQHCGTWFPSEYQRGKHDCAQLKTLSLPPGATAKSLEHSQICKHCEQGEPGKKKFAHHHCILCNYHGDRRRLVEHFQKIHLGTKTEYCDICDKVTKNLQQHQYYAHNDIKNRYKCKYCDYRTSHYNVLSWHMGAKHKDLGLISCDKDPASCKFVAFSHKQVERHKFYIHAKAEPIPKELSEGEKYFIRRGIPVFQNFDGLPGVPEGTVLHDCPQGGCHYQSLTKNGISKHKRIFHDEMDIDKFMNESV